MSKAEQSVYLARLEAENRELRAEVKELKEVMYDAVFEAREEGWQAGAEWGREMYRD